VNTTFAPSRSPRPHTGAGSAPDGPRIGSLCTGYGGLDEAALAVFGGSVAWHCQYDPDDKHQYAAQILARHWPDIPNHGDITTVDYHQVEPVDILTAGFPCQDLSLAGKRAGIAEGTKSGLWLHVARAIEALQPRLVVIENVRGILSQKADRGLGPDAPGMDPATGARFVLRALGAVLGDLAELGLDAEWAGVQAAEVGAPHERFREFILAWPAAADSDDDGAQRPRPTRRTAERHTAGEDREPSDAAGEGLEGRRVRGRATGGREATEDADGSTRGERRLPAPGQEESRGARADTGGRGGVLDARRSGGAAAVEPDCPTCGCPESFHDAGGFCAGCQQCTDPDLGRPGETAADADSDAVRQQSVAEPGGGGASVPGIDRQPVADAEGDGRDEGRTEPAGQQGGSDASVGGGADVQWGEYEPAVRRWEGILGRPSPRPVDDRGRLNPAFVEWMMGLPAGHVTDTPGLPRSAQLKALGNGVVPQQAEAALRLLVARAEPLAVAS
jgi:DNA (cytosine-5)-methyltransferase 1